MDLFKITKSKTKEKILRLFFADPDKSYYLRELERIIKVPVGTIRREILALAKIKIFESERRGNLVYFFLNKKHPFYKELKNIIFKTIGVEGWLRQTIQSVKGVETAFIYGSFANQEEDTMSDIDLMIIGQPSADELIRVIKKLEGEFQREINYSVIGRAEFLRKKKKDSFLKNIIKEPKIILVGQL